MEKIKTEVVVLLIAISIIAGVEIGTSITLSAYRQAIREEQQQAGKMDARELRSMKIFARILWGESSARACVGGDHDKKYRSFGPAQYQERTFNEFKEEAGLPWLEWKNPEHQLILTWWAVKNNKEQRWTVARDVDF